MSKSRVEAFTDAVIAIIMTILVLNLEAPQSVSFEALYQMRYSFLYYLISFLLLAIYWLNHHHLFQIAKKISGKVLWINILFILCLSFFPFTTSWADDNPGDRVPQLTYGVVILLTNIFFALLSRELMRVNGKDSMLSKSLRSLWKNKVTIAINVVGLAAGFFWPPAVLVLFAASMVLWIVPDRQIEKFLNDGD